MNMDFKMPVSVLLTSVKRVVLLLMLLLVLASCKVELYSELTEQDANEMIFLLQAKGIEVTREQDVEGGYKISVDRDNFSKAMAFLSQSGLPKEKFVGIQETFGQQKLVTSEYEERIRYINALNQELSESLTHVQGVSLARVHISVPEKLKLGKEPPKSKASVFLYYSGESPPSITKPMIKELIVSSANNIDYENVAVAILPMDSRELNNNIIRTTKEKMWVYWPNLLIAVVLFLSALWLWLRGSRRPTVRKLPHIGRGR